MSCQIRRILQFKEAVVYQEIKILDFNNVDITNSCMYSWSTDMVCWTGWASYSDYVSICKNIESDFYLRVLLFGSFDKVMTGGEYNTCYNVCLDTTSPFLQDFCGQSNLFQPYNNLDCALQLQQQLSDSVICMFGIPVYYLRVQPNIDSASYTFKEYSLHDVVDIKQIKIMVEDGMMPSSNPHLTEFDFDWESDWEVEIGKSQFAQAFGDTVFPKQRDLVYIPMMKRMWEINSAYDEKNEGLMWRPTTWKLAMTKYNEKTNVNQGDFESLIDGWVVNNYESTFGERERNEWERLTGENQVDSPRFAANVSYEDLSLQDAIRYKYTKDHINVIDNQLYHRNALLTRNMYSCDELGEIIYQKKACGSDGTLSFIISTTPGAAPDIDKTIIYIGDVKAKVKGRDGSYYISFEDMECELASGSTYMVILRWNKRNFVSELHVYPYEYRKDVPQYLLKSNMYYIDYEHPTFEEISLYNNDFDMITPQQCSISGWPVGLTNIKYYNTTLNDTEMITESTKYVTQHESCIINDLARPMTDGLGYAVR